jgi:hypothetical protein
MEGTLNMSQEEIKRVVVMERVKRGTLKLVDAAGCMLVSYRQAKRIWARFKQDGAKGLLHKSRGRPSNRAMSEDFRFKVLNLYKEKYYGFGPTFASEKLDELDRIEINDETLRLWLMEDGLWSKHRQRKKHRLQRQRRDHFGELLQMDGSTHRWFSKIKRDYCLLSIVDDATGVTLSRFDYEETTQLAMRTLWEWIKLYGIPREIYVDGKNSYVLDKKTIEDMNLEEDEALTQFGMACKKLGIKIIRAHSPQAKGRVERKNGVHQDRLVKELKLKDINEIEEGNNFLRDYYLKKINNKFSKEPMSEINFHMKVSKGLDLRTVFCIEERRCVNNDWTVRHKNTFYQIEKDNEKLPNPKDRVVISTWLDGTIHIMFNGRALKYKRIESRPEKIGEKPSCLPGRQVNRIREKYKPAKDHPWRKSNYWIFRKMKQQLRSHLTTELPSY